jgi:tRNA nucleotidyltransferase (CCA-adding enzyme)
MAISADRTVAELWGRMPPASRELCRRAARLAEGLGQAVYLVGGSLRDLLLGAAHVDLDLVVEGDAMALADAIGAELGGVVHGPSQFLTAMVNLPGGGRLDLATARQETYPEPTKLPVVRPADIRADLCRRDFSINALALRLTARGAGDLVDPCGGRQDLADRLIRVLHERSFADDPTRLIRCARFAVRLGFALEPQTRALAIEAAHAELLGRVTGARVRDEVIKLLREPDPGAVLAWLADFGAHRQLLPGLQPDRRMYAWLRRTPVPLAALAGHRALARPTWPYLLGALAAWADPLAVVERLDLDSDAAAIVLAMARAMASALPAAVAARTPLANERLDRALDGASVAVLVVYWLRSGPAARRRVERYATELRQRRAGITGHDLAELHGPAVGVALRAARRAGLGGKADRGAQLKAALDAVAQWRRPAKRVRQRSGR